MVFLYEGDIHLSCSHILKSLWRLVLDQTYIKGGLQLEHTATIRKRRLIVFVHVRSYILCNTISALNN